MNKVHLLPIIMLSYLHGMEEKGLPIVQKIAWPIVISSWIGDAGFTVKNEEQNVKDLEQASDEKIEKYFLKELNYKQDTIKYAYEVLRPLSMVSLELNDLIHSQVDQVKRKEKYENFFISKYIRLWSYIDYDCPQSNNLLEKSLNTEWIEKINPVFGKGDGTVAQKTLHYYGNNHDETRKSLLKIFMPKMENRKFSISGIKLNENKTVLDEVLKENGMCFESFISLTNHEENDGMPAHCSPSLKENKNYVFIRKQAPENKTEERSVDWSVCTIQ
ncbi:hypothetical protein IPH25_00060 [bacterium]|nr:MAG: hypothetical protein IPG37_02175 [bacterium]QQR61827.1 MAG: hypothetical protein IPH25_00060 [bacterium]QQR62591.1 MAG: hypothetical protein IPH67_04195 [bacterium]